MTAETIVENETSIYLQYGISPAVARMCVEKNPEGLGFDEAYNSHLENGRSGWLAAMCRIAEGDQPRYLLEDAIAPLLDEQEQQGVFARKISLESLRDISATVIRVYEPQVEPLSFSD